MTDLDLAEQLVAYVDATTEPVVVVTSAAADDRSSIMDISHHSASDESWDRRWLVAVAALAVLALVGAVVLVAGGSESPDRLEIPADDPVAPNVISVPGPTDGAPGADGDAPSGPGEVDPVRAAAAVAAAEEYFAAFAAGDHAVVIGASDPAAIDASAEEQLVGWWSQAAWPGRSHPGWPGAPCAAVDEPAADVVLVQCDTPVGDPVATALGLDALVWEVEVFDGAMVRRTAEPLANGRSVYWPVWRAYRDYIDAFRPDETTACDPATSDTPTAVVPAGLALTVECGSLTATVANRVADWVDRGRPAVVPLSEEYLHGYWLNTAGFSSLFVDFRRDGTYTVNRRGPAHAGVASDGTYEVTADDTVVLTEAAGEGKRCPGDLWTWTGAATDDGVMRIDAVAPTCGEDYEGDWEWTKVSPVSTAGSALPAGELEVEPVAVGENTDVNGLWLRVGTGEVLSIGLDGTYLFTDTGDSLAPLDAGTYSIGAPGVVTFTSDGTGECGVGETWTWTGVTTAVDLQRENDPRGTTMRADLAPLCGSIGGGDDWRLLTPDKFAAG